MRDEPAELSVQENTLKVSTLAWEMELFVPEGQLKLFDEIEKLKGGITANIDKEGLLSLHAGAKVLRIQYDVSTMEVRGYSLENFKKEPMANESTKKAIQR